MADFVGSTACPWWPCDMPLCSPSPGSKGRADRPARQQEGSTMTEASVSFAGTSPTTQLWVANGHHLE
jgi:hypothetical protein